jgi:hypothetical protein
VNATVLVGGSQGRPARAVAAGLGLVAIAVALLTVWLTIEIVLMNADGYLYHECAWLMGRPPPLWQMITTGLGAGACAVSAAWFSVRCALGRGRWLLLLSSLGGASALLGIWLVIGTWTAVVCRGGW